MERIALFPGSFDPITIGHESLVLRSLGLFDKIVIGIGTNSSKRYLYSLEERMAYIRSTFAEEPKISVESYTGLTVDFCEKIGARFILRGLRTSSDFEFERAIAQMNRAMYRNIETIFLVSLPEHSAINSTIVRDIVSNGGDASAFVPKSIVL